MNQNGAARSHAKKNDEDFANYALLRGIVLKRTCLG